MFSKLILVEIYGTTNVVQKCMESAQTMCRNELRDAMARCKCSLRWALQQHNHLLLTNVNEYLRYRSPKRFWVGLKEYLLNTFSNVVLLILTLNTLHGKQDALYSLAAIYGGRPNSSGGGKARHREEQVGLPHGLASSEQACTMSTTSHILSLHVPCALSQTWNLQTQDVFMLSNSFLSWIMHICHVKRLLLNETCIYTWYYAPCPMTLKHNCLLSFLKYYVGIFYMNCFLHFY